MPPTIYVEKTLMDSEGVGSYGDLAKRSRLPVMKIWRLILDRCRSRLLLEDGRGPTVARGIAG